MAGRHFLMTIDFAEDLPARKAPHQPSHLQHVFEATRRGLLLGGYVSYNGELERHSIGDAGAPPGGVNRGVHLWLADTPEEVEQYIRADPYFLAGLITGYEIVEFFTTVGELAVNSAPWYEEKRRTATEAG